MEYVLVNWLSAGTTGPKYWHWVKLVLILIACDDALDLDMKRIDGTPTLLFRQPNEVAVLLTGCGDSRFGF